MDADEQKAESLKYGPDTWMFLEVRPGIFAVFDTHRQLQLIGPIETIISCYRKRSIPFEAHFDLSDLEI